MVPFSSGSNISPGYVRAPCWAAKPTDRSQRFGLSKRPQIGAVVFECGFEVWNRLASVHPNWEAKCCRISKTVLLTNKAQRRDRANSGEGADGYIMSGELFKIATYWPAPNWRTPIATMRQAMQSNCWLRRVTTDLCSPQWDRYCPRSYHPVVGGI